MSKNIIRNLIKKALKEQKESPLQELYGCNPSEWGICCCPPIYLPCCGPIELPPSMVAVLEGDDCTRCTEEEDKRSCNKCKQAYKKVDSNNSIKKLSEYAATGAPGEHIKFDPDEVLDINAHSKSLASEAEISVGAENTTFSLKVDVSNKQSETKLGIRIQLSPKEGMLEPDVRDKLEAVVMKKLNTSLGQYDIQVSTDTDVPDPSVIGFFIPLSQIKNMIVSSIKGSGTAPAAPQATPQPTLPGPAGAPTEPEPEGLSEVIDQLIKEEYITEMRVRELKEISQTISKEDFYEFINKGNNILRTLEENNIPNGKKYLEYLVRHNII